FVELRVRLAGEAHDKGGSQIQVRYRPAEFAEERLRGRAVDVSRHALQDPVVDVLQRHVEVRDDLFRVRQYINQFVAEVHRVRIEDADPLDSVHAIELFQ